MTKAMKKRLQLICGIALIVLSSLSCGAILGYLAGSRNADDGRQSLRQIRDDLFALMVKDLKLNPEQQVQAGEILDRSMVLTVTASQGLTCCTFLTISGRVWGERSQRTFMISSSPSGIRISSIFEFPSESACGIALPFVISYTGNL